MIWTKLFYKDFSCWQLPNVCFIWKRFKFFLSSIQELLGHSNPQTTMRYAHLGLMILREAVRAFDKPHTFLNLRHNSVTIHDFSKSECVAIEMKSSINSANDKTKTGL